MPRCAHCNKTILFGGVRQGEFRFCNQQCMLRGMVASTASEIPSDLVSLELDRLHKGPCPICRGDGPVDVHKSHFAQSFIFVTRWGTKPRISCCSCAKKEQLSSLLSTAALGWWGFPWGLIATPIQIVRNISAMTGGPNPTQPSPELENFVRAAIARQVMTEVQSQARSGALGAGASNG